MPAYRTARKVTRLHVNRPEMSAAIWFRGDFSCVHRGHFFDVRCFKGSCPYVRRITTAYVLPFPHGSNGDRRGRNPNLPRRLRLCAVTNGGKIPTKYEEMLPLLKHGGIRSTLCRSANALFATGHIHTGISLYIYKPSHSLLFREIPHALFCKRVVRFFNIPVSYEQHASINVDQWSRC